MKNTVREKLLDEISSELDALSTLTPGSKEHAEAAETVGKLYKLYIEDLKSEREHILQSEEATNAEVELEVKKLELEQSKTFQYIRAGLEAAGIVFPLVFSWIWMKRGFRFEQEGTYTSKTFQWLFGKFRFK